MFVIQAFFMVPRSLRATPVRLAIAATVFAAVLRHIAYTVARRTAVSATTGITTATSIASGLLHPYAAPMKLRTVKGFRYFFI